MQTNELIDKLAKQKMPEKPLPHPLLQGGWWLLLFAVYLVAVTMVGNIRTDILRVLQQPLFISEMIFVLATIISAAASVICLSVPDMYQKHWITKMPIAAFSMLTALLLYGIATNGDYDNFSNGLVCSGEICIYAFAPAVIFVLILRRAVTLYSKKVGALCGLSAGLMGYLFLRLTEQNDDMIHIFIWHYTPVLAIVALGMVCAARYLKF